MTVEQARAELNALIPRFSELFPVLFTPDMLESSGISTDVHPYVDDLVGEIRPVLLVLLATVSFVLLIACASVANLLLVRAEGRWKEVAIRSALGASREHFLTGYFTESFLLAVMGATLGVLVAKAGLGLLLGAFALSRFPGSILFQIDPDDPLTFGSVTVVLLLVSLAATWFPAMRAAGTDPVRALRQE